MPPVRATPIPITHIFAQEIMHALPVFAVFFLVNRKNQQPSINVSGKNEKKTEEAQREEGLKIAVDILKREIAKYDDVAAKPRYNIIVARSSWSCCMC